MLRKTMLALLLVAGGFLAACTQNSNYIEVVGGGFMFNYRIASAFAGLVVVPVRELPANAAIEVTMENPAGGPPVAMQQSPAGGGKIEFTTSSLKGIVADKPYAVVVRLVDGSGKELQRIEKIFKSQLDQSVLPDAPLTVGPGYAKPPPQQQ